MSSTDDSRSNQIDMFVDINTGVIEQFAKGYSALAEELPSEHWDLQSIQRHIESVRRQLNLYKPHYIDRLAKAGYDSSLIDDFDVIEMKKLLFLKLSETGNLRRIRAILIILE
jgi:hypothetical protein